MTFLKDVLDQIEDTVRGSQVRRPLSAPRQLR